MKISTGITQGIFLAGSVFCAGHGRYHLPGASGEPSTLCFGGKAKFGSIFAVWMYAMLPSCIKTILGIVVLFAGLAPESFNIKNFAPTNLGAFLNPMETNQASTASHLNRLHHDLDPGSGWNGSRDCCRYRSAVRATSPSFGWWALIVICSEQDCGRLSADLQFIQKKTAHIARCAPSSFSPCSTSLRPYLRPSPHNQRRIDPAEPERIRQRHIKVVLDRPCSAHNPACTPDRDCRD